MISNCKDILLQSNGSNHINGNLSKQEKFSCNHTFGWDIHIDKQRNLVYLLHQYTGEVRWLPPEEVGFIMDGIKPLPVKCKSIPRSSKKQYMRYETWNPYYPHVVMVPSGLLLVHPPPNYSKSSGYSTSEDMMCKYNRFPLAKNGKNGLSLEQSIEQIRQRVLPPTWEQHTQDNSPFLPPYPVTVLPNSNDTQIQQEFCHSNEVEVLQTTLSQVSQSTDSKKHKQWRGYSHDSLGNVLNCNTYLPMSSSFTHSSWPSNRSKLDGWERNEKKSRDIPIHPKGTIHFNNDKTKTPRDHSLSQAQKNHNRRGYSFRLRKKLLQQSDLGQKEGTSI